MKPPIDDAGPPAISNWRQLIANAVEQLVEAFDQLQLPLRELLFLPSQRLSFLYQRAKRPDECIGHETLNASSEVRCLPDHSTGKIPALQAIDQSPADYRTEVTLSSSR